MGRYTLKDIQSNSFYQLPKFLFAADYINMSNDAKILYALLRDRMSLSIKNRWIDVQGAIYLIYTRDEMGTMLKKSKNTIKKMVDELKEYKLLDEVRQGLNKPNLLYLLTPDTLQADYPYNTDLDKEAKDELEDIHDVLNTVESIENTRKVNFCDSGLSKIATQESQEVTATKTNNNKTETYLKTDRQSEGRLIETEEDFERVQNYFENNLGLTELKAGPLKLDAELLDELELHVLDMYYSDGVRINGVLKNKWLIRKALLRLNSMHIQYIVNSYKKAAQNSKINHIRGYIQAMLYNCAHESELKVLSDVEYDLNNS